MSRPEYITRSSGMTRSSYNTHNTHDEHDKHVQPWYPPAPKFYGKTTSNDAYQQWEIPKHATKSMNQVPEYKPLPFHGTTETGDRYQEHKLEPRERKEAMPYVPNNAKFYGETTSGQTYQEWELPKREIQNNAAPAYKPLPFNGTTTSQDNYKAYEIQPRQPSQQPAQYKPNNAKFYGDTTSAQTYQAWELPKREIHNNAAPEYKPLPFHGTTTSQDNYKAYEIEPRQSSQQPKEYVPNNAKFYGETTSGQTYQEWELPKREIRNNAAPEYKPLPFHGTTTAQEDFKEYPIEVKPPAQPIEYKPNKAYFYGSTTYGETFKAHELPRHRPQSTQQAPEYTSLPFTGRSTAQDNYRSYDADEIAGSRPHQAHGQAPYEPNQAKFYGSTESMEQYKAHKIEPRRQEHGAAPVPKSLPFTGTTTSSETFRGWQLPHTHKSIGVEILNDGYFVMLPRSKSDLKRHTCMFTTVADNQSVVEIKILQGESPKASDNEVIASLELVGIAKAKCGEPQIAVTLSITDGNILHVDAVDSKSGVEQHIAIDKLKNPKAFA